MISQQLPKAILVMISALIAYQVALLTWSLYPTQESTYIWTPPRKASAENNTEISSDKLQEENLFGEYHRGSAPTAVQSSKEAPKTKLNLTLVGIVAASDPLFSSAIIEYKGAQESYYVESTITGTNAKVSEIHDDRIIINVNGELQTLILDGLELANQRMAAIEGQQVTGIDEVKSSERATKIDLDREELLSNPGKLMDFINISPVREGDEIKGYRVNPGKDPSLFEESGLEPGDLAVELNGVDLTDLGESMALMKEFPTMTEITLTVDRDGELNELYFSIP